MPGSTSFSGSDQASLHRQGDLFDVETLYASYQKQSFKAHAHDTYMFGVIEAGVHQVWCRGETHFADAGTVVTMRPGDVHYGKAGVARGWQQRMIYISEQAMDAVLTDLADCDRRVPLDFAAPFHHRPDLAHRCATWHRTLHDPSQTLTLAREEALHQVVQDIVTAFATVPPQNPVTRPMVGLPMPSPICANGWTRTSAWTICVRLRDCVAAS